jgi:uncharacterized surface protein with fasciclin (FAS1) repeats
MKNYFLKPLVVMSMFVGVACQSEQKTDAAVAPTENNEAQATGQSGVKDDISNPNVVQIAVGSKDHSTLVAAVKAAELVDALSNAGPFTVFAPTNAAFDKLPAGTVEGLLVPEKKADLKNILEYHTYVGVLKAEYLQDGQEFEQVNGGKVKITRKGDEVFVNGSKIVASIPASNGVIHVIGDVLLPK